jgi:hypothetical protein
MYSKLDLGVTLSPARRILRAATPGSKLLVYPATSTERASSATTTDLRPKPKP